MHEFEETHKRLREFEEIEISRQNCRGESDFLIQVGGVSRKLRTEQAHELQVKASFIQVEGVSRKFRTEQAHEL
jgi:hypothetical protein